MTFAYKTDAAANYRQLQAPATVADEQILRVNGGYCEGYFGGPSRVAPLSRHPIKIRKVRIC
jgi:hypothetical protein